MRVQDIVNMNKHDKQTIYEAYSISEAVRKQLNEDLNHERMQNFELIAGVMAWQDSWLEQVIRSEVSTTGDIEKDIADYFAHPDRDVVMTKNKGFYAYTHEGDHLFIWFAWTNPRHWGTERRDMVKLIKELNSHGLPIRYVGTANVMKSHSVDLGDGTYELRLS